MGLSLRIKHLWGGIGLLLAVFFITLAAISEPVIPSLNSPVTDLTSTLTKNQIDALDAKLRGFQATKGGQIVLLIVSDLGGLAIEDYSIKLAEKWQVGRKGIDDGVILLIAKNDRKLRIEVGGAYEGALTDAESSRIIREIITPRFKQGDFFGGISEGLDAVIGQVNGEELPPPQREFESSIDGSVMELFVFIVFLLSAASTMLRKFIGRLPAALLVTAVVALVAFSILPQLFAAVTTVLSFLFSFFAEQLSRMSGAGGVRSSSGGGWSSSGSSYGGGGGRFSGGGASGSW